MAVRHVVISTGKGRKGSTKDKRATKYVFVERMTIQMIRCTCTLLSKENRETVYRLSKKSRKKVR